MLDIRHSTTAQVIDDTHREPTHNKGIDSMAADETRPAGDDGDRPAQLTFATFICRTLK